MHREFRGSGISAGEVSSCSLVNAWRCASNEEKEVGTENVGIVEMYEGQGSDKGRQQREHGKRSKVRKSNDSLLLWPRKISKWSYYRPS